MFFAAILATLFVCGNAFVLPGLKPNGRIAGGTPAQISEVPFHVALLLDYWNVGAYSQSCSGTILSAEVVVTVASCIDASFAAQWRIRAGSSIHTTGGQVVQVGRYLMHPRFNSRLDNDIALMFMARNISLSSIIMPIPLPEQGQYVNDSSVGLLSGWGTFVDGGPQPNQLHKVSMPIVPQDECVEAYASFNPVTENMLCAGRLGVGGIGACLGDSGGPFVINATLVGMTSWGRGCGEPDSPDVLTRIPEFVDWIEESM